MQTYILIICKLNHPAQNGMGCVTNRIDIIRFQVKVDMFRCLKYKPWEYEGLLQQAPLIIMSFFEQALPPTCAFCPRGPGTRKVRIWATARPTGWIKSLRRFVVSKHFHLPEWAAKMCQFTDHTVVKVKRSPVPYFAAHSFYYHWLRWRHTAFKHPNGNPWIDPVLSWVYA